MARSNRKIIEKIKKETACRKKQRNLNWKDWIKRKGWKKKLADEKIKKGW